ncbi:hypothetical protein [Neobacillus dielmonensis]|uniref:hypothetical protein n=1 Tax=Neobacillus dielmonensis TaxID=1347369 RepID=UPI0005A7F2F9|nr:hypothetical protein [Neobacillus dielmonensis]
MELQFVFDDDVFTYAISNGEMDQFSQHLSLANSSLTVNYTRKTDVVHGILNNQEIVIIGLCVDAYGDIERNDIPAFFLAQKFEQVERAYKFFNCFAGKYVILFRDGEQVYLWGDATCTIQINYSFATDESGAVCAASLDKIVASYFQYRISEYSTKIRLGSDFSQPMPADLTMYAEVKALLPNHYLDLFGKKAVRVGLDVTPAKTHIELNHIIEVSIKLIEQIVREYAKFYEIICPLTSGYDSRLVFSFLKKQNQHVQCYTFKHKGFTTETDDMLIPAKICEYYQQPYSVVEDLVAPEDYVQEIFAVAGDYNAESTINLACTFNSAFLGKALINGDIIDQIGKSLLGHAIPNRLASAAYLRCKVHNREKQTKQVIEQYLDGLRDYGESKYVFDLFAMESRCGRWASQGGALYALCGITSLNIFNCRELILNWVSVPRKLRSKKWIHQEIYRVNDQRLLQFAFNPSSKTDFLKKHWILFYIATYVKQFLYQMR